MWARDRKGENRIISTRTVRVMQWCKLQFLIPLVRRTVVALAIEYKCIAFLTQSKPRHSEQVAGAVDDVAIVWLPGSKWSIKFIDRNTLILHSTQHRYGFSFFAVQSNAELCARAHYTNYTSTHIHGYAINIYSKWYTMHNLVRSKGYHYWCKKLLSGCSG